jgi:hypothetical protein
MMIDISEAIFEQFQTNITTSCESLQAHCRVPALADEPALHGKR